MQAPLVVPSLERLPRYRALLERGWTPDHLRGPIAAHEELARIEADPALYIARCTNLNAEGGPITLPDGRKAARIPGRVFWIWGASDEAEADCVGTINIRLQPGTPALPEHVLGHTGYAVVPWARGRGHATAALKAVRPWLRDQRLPYFEVTCDADNAASVKVIERAGGVLHERFDKPAYWGGKASLRFRIAL